MRLIYLSHDELNRAMVCNWAGRKGIAVECPTRVDAAMGGLDAAVLIDADHLPPDWLERFLGQLCASGGVSSLAAHGYGTASDTLRRRGLAVYPRLRSRVLAELTAVATSLRRVPARDVSDTLTWVNLA